MSDNLEFYIYEGELWCKRGLENTLIDSTQQELLNDILDRIRNDYPDAYKALEECYKKSAPNKNYYKYIMARRFLRCNFAQLDSTSYDIEENKVNFERVDCPLRGECKYDGIICSPIYKTSLSAQEIKVGALWYEGLSKDEIAGVLFLSPETINNHIRNIYKKLNIHEKAEFIKYADDKKLFNRRIS